MTDSLEDEDNAMEDRDYIPTDVESDEISETEDEEMDDIDDNELHLLSLPEEHNRGDLINTTSNELNHTRTTHNNQINEGHNTVAPPQDSDN